MAHSSRVALSTAGASQCQLPDPGDAAYFLCTKNCVYLISSVVSTSKSFMTAKNQCKRCKYGSCGAALYCA
eukprot:scaffold190951_cov21-Prasinocladus_malaysianus.AAC.1